MDNEQRTCPNCGGTEEVFSMERVTIMYSVAPDAGKEGGWGYTGHRTEVLDETADAFGLYCRSCDTEFQGWAE